MEEQLQLLDELPEQAACKNEHHAPANTAPTIQELMMMGPEDGVAMPSFEATKNFLREYYLHSRFEGRDGPQWGKDYSGEVTKGVQEILSRQAITCVSVYECNRGRAIWFGRALTVLNPDEPPAQIQRSAGHLTHIFGQSM